MYPTSICFGPKVLIYRDDFKAKVIYYFGCMDP